MKPPRLRRDAEVSEREEWMATATKFAVQLTETGSRCHLNTGTPRFCAWHALELSDDGAGDLPTMMVGVRCTAHSGGRYLDADARFHPDELA